MQRHAYQRQFRRYARQHDHFPVAGVLIILGLLVWALSSFAFFWALILLAAGAVLTVLAVSSDRRWMLLAGGVLLGSGAGQLVALPLGWVSGTLADAATTAGLGFGFWFAYLLESRRFHSTHFGWAPIVGTILLVIAAVRVISGLAALSWRFLHVFLSWWPLLIIAVGFWLIWVGYRARRSR
jgi:hypothetical protein